MAVHWCISCTIFFRAITQVLISAMNISCFSVGYLNSLRVSQRIVETDLCKLYQPRRVCLVRIETGYLRSSRENAYRAAPYIRLLDSLKANGSAGVAIRSQSWAISAVITDRFGSFLKADFEPSVAANLWNALSTFSVMHELVCITYHSKPKPLSRRESNSGVKNMVKGTIQLREQNSLSRVREVQRFHLLGGKKKTGKLRR